MAGNGRSRPSAAAIAALVVVSVALPGGLLALIVVNDSTGGTPTVAGTAPATTAGNPIDTRRARVGTPAPPFSLPDTDGRSVSLAGLRGKPVVIAFFASWCHPCEEELPVLEQFARDEGGRLQVVGISYRDLPSDSVDFVHRLGVTFPALLDQPTAPVAERYGVRGIPQTVFVDARGIVRGRVYGVTSRDELAPAITDLLAGRDVRPV
jgi:cytochrome c biogenesis protein CcmG, thiol:disulfide interchange protein DsbE